MGSFSIKGTYPKIDFGSFYVTFGPEGRKEPSKARGWMLIKIQN